MEALGINITEIIIWVILFVIVFFVVDKFLLKALMETIQKRRAEIEETQQLQEKLKSDEAQTAIKQTELLAGTKIEAQEIIIKSKQEAKLEAEQIVLAAKEESAQIIAKANAKLDLEKAKLNKELEQRVEASTQKALAKLYSKNKLEIDAELIKSVINEL